LSLTVWCDASAAKFNEGKTEIIPIGSENYRKELVTTRKLSPNDEPIPPEIRIAKDGHAVQSLGAWIGNHVNNAITWQLALDKIQRKLNTWSKRNPTLTGKKHITQMYPGNMTQFLAKAQGMPRNVEETLVKIIRKFIWSDNRSQIALETLYQPRENGGIDLLNVPARNEAIQLMWMKSYLELSPLRPTWAYVTDALIYKTAPQNISTKTLINTYLHDWEIPARSPKLTEDIQRMLAAARKHHIQFAPLKISERLKEQLPAWLHMGALPRTYNSARDECLRNTHELMRVSDLITLAERDKRNISGRRHTKRRNCACSECRNDRKEGCDDPNKCCETAKVILSKIQGKWAPGCAPQTSDNLSLTHHRKEKNNQALTAYQGEITFDPSITIKTCLADCIRVFTDKEKLSPETACRLTNLQRGITSGEEITVYTDGSATNNGKNNSLCGAGIFFGPDNPKNMALRIQHGPNTNQVGELAAVIAALQKTENFMPLTIKSDSRYVINGLTKHLGEWEDNGWFGVDNKELFQAAAYQLRIRSAKTSFEWVKGHSGVPGNEAADQAAAAGTLKPTPDELDLTVPDAFNIQGAKLRTLTQKLAYRAITLNQKYQPRDTATLNVTEAQDAILDATGQEETTSTIWKGLKNKGIRNNTSQFLYKTIHNTYILGKRWLNIPDQQQRATCQACEENWEDMRHILIDCDKNEAAQVWAMARNAWPHEDYKWPKVHLGTITGCGAIQFKPRNDKRGEEARAAGASRLVRIIISESAHLIWCLRCDRSMNNNQLSPDAIQSAWKNRIRSRLNADYSEGQN
jgi:ribonuclease HI